jgi:hypothetical protein
LKSLQEARLMPNSARRSRFLNIWERELNVVFI